MIKYNIATQKKIEDLFDQIGYTVRYEKGNFNSGYCILEAKKVVVINKFHSLESKINSLLEILTLIEFDTTLLSKTSIEIYHEFVLKNPTLAL